MQSYALFLEKLISFIYPRSPVEKFLLTVLWCNLCKYGCLLRCCGLINEPRDKIIFSCNWLYVRSFTVLMKYIIHVFLIWICENRLCMMIMHLKVLYELSLHWIQTTTWIDLLSKFERFYVSGAPILYSVHGIVEKSKVYDD